MPSPKVTQLVAYWWSQDQNPGTQSQGCPLPTAPTTVPGTRAECGEEATLTLWLKCDRYGEIPLSSSALTKIFSRKPKYHLHHCQ